jgi:hypothetical protein
VCSQRTAEQNPCASGLGRVSVTHRAAIRCNIFFPYSRANFTRILCSSPYTFHRVPRSQHASVHGTETAPRPRLRLDITLGLLVCARSSASRAPTPLQLTGSRRPTCHSKAARRHCGLPAPLSAAYQVAASPPLLALELEIIAINATSAPMCPARTS